MPSLVASVGGEPILVNYDTPKGKSNMNNSELFQNGIKKDAYNISKVKMIQVKETPRSEVLQSPKQVSPDSTVATDPSLAWKLSGKSHRDGPDQILPSNADTTVHADGAVKIRYRDAAASKRKPVSVPTMLRRCADRAPDHMALGIKQNGEWVKWTYKEYYRDVRTVAKGFIALGLERFHSVCILGFNSPEWFMSDMGAIFAGGFAAGVYTTNNAEACAYVAKDSRCNIYVVEDDKQLAKVLEYKDELPHLKAIVQYSGEPTVEGVVSWSKLMLIGQEQPDSILDERLSQIAINQCCTLIYTSGTTGNPKGVMLSHDNLTWTAQSCAEYMHFRELEEEYISFLPLSHIAAQMADMYCSLTCCGSLFFADKNALKGSLIDTMREIKPTKFLAVPRVWEKMYEKMQEIGRSTTGIKKTIATWAKAKGLEYTMKKMNGAKNPKSIGFQLANKIVLTKVRDALGLTRCDLNLSGAAPISQDILKYFMSLNICVTEIYGMSESTGPHCTGLSNGAFRLGSCGKTLPGIETKIDKPDADGNGEILMYGRHVNMGYLGQPEKTHASIDSEGYLHTEDIGHVDKDGYLFITGRLKELLITAGGENVAPVPIEDRIKFELPIVSQAMVLGDRLKFLSVLLTLKTEVDKDTLEPLDKLLPYTKQWIESNGDCQVHTIHDVMEQINVNKNQKLIQAIQKGIDRANAKAVSQAQKLQKWKLLPVDFSVPGGELGPTLKLKRQVVYKKYNEEIEEIYN